MSDLVLMPVDGSEPILLDVDRRIELVGRGQERFESAGESFQRGLARVQEIAGHVLDRLSSLPRRPCRVRVEFGVKLTAEANVILTRTTGDAHFVVELEWNDESASAQRDG